MAAEFVLVRLTKISGVDLHQFDFDYDLNFFVFFLNAEGKVYGRYGGRDASGAEKRLSLKGLRYALNAALEAHRKEAKAQPAAPKAKPPLLVDDYPAAKRMKPGECIHCHQVNEFRRDFLKAKGQWTKDLIWGYPLPENVGVTLDVDQGDLVRAVEKGSAADKAGLRVGDLLKSVNGVAVASIADVMYGLHRGPAKGQISVAWVRDGKPVSADLQVADGWRKTNITWRPSLLDVLAAPTLEGDDLSAAEKKALSLEEKRLAFRLDEPDDDTRSAGLRKGDVILGVDGQKLELTARGFLGYLRKNYLIGEKVTINVIRDGRALDVPLTLR